MIVVCIKNPRQSGSCCFFKNIIKIILNNYMQFLTFTKIRACVAVSEFQFQFPLYVEIVKTLHENYKQIHCYDTVDVG